MSTLQTPVSKRRTRRTCALKSLDSEVAVQFYVCGGSVRHSCQAMGYRALCQQPCVAIPQLTCYLGLFDSN